MHYFHVSAAIFLLAAAGCRPAAPSADAPAGKPAAAPQPSAPLPVVAKPLPADLVAVPDAKCPPLKGLAAGSKEAQEVQKKAVTDLGLPLEVKTKKTGIVFRLVPAGSFTMGSPAAEAGHEDEEKEHRVTLTKPFYCGKFEVTQGQWQAVMGANPSYFKRAGVDAPVEMVSWEDCQAFVKKLAQLEGVAEGAYRLLTEAEWEYACRAGTATALYNGALTSTLGKCATLGKIAWYAENSGNAPHVGGGKLPNAWGLHDLSGNVWEWCGDWYEAYPAAAVTDPAGAAAGTRRVRRGGSLYFNATTCRAANRDGYFPGHRFHYVGLRLLRVAAVQSHFAADPPAQVVPPVTPKPLPTPPVVVTPPPAEGKEPVEGQDHTVAELGMEFVWVKALNAWMGKYEVTNGEYRKMKPDHDSAVYDGHTLNGDRQPVVYVNWDDAVAYAKWLTDRERAAGRLPAGWVYRVPTENEWAACASCGDNRKYPWGNDWPPKYGNYAGTEAKATLGYQLDGYTDGEVVTCAVEKSGKNDWGLYGMGGNVWEVCIDSADRSEFGAWRGASWHYDRVNGLRVAFRYFYFGADNSSVSGFRLFLSR